VDDVLTVSGGTNNNAATFTVTSVGGSGEVTGIELTTHGDYTVTPANPASTTVAPAGGSGCTLTVTYENGEELRFITAGTTTLTVNEDWVNIPVSGEDWAVSYIMEDVATVNGCTLNSKTGVFECTRPLIISDLSNTDFAFLGLAEGKAVEIDDTGGSGAGFEVSHSGYFVNGYLQAGVAVNGGYLFGINNTPFEDAWAFQDGGRVFFYDLQYRSALADLEWISGTDTGGDTIRVAQGCKFFNVTDAAQLRGWVIRDCTLAAAEESNNRPILEPNTDIDGLTLVNTDGLTSVDDDVTEEFTVRNCTFIGNTININAHSDKTWKLVNPLEWRTNARLIWFDTVPDLSFVDRLYSLDLVVKELDGTAVERALTMIYEGRENQDLPIENQQLTDADGVVSSDVLREAVDQPPTTSTSLDAAIADDGGSYTDETTAASNATPNDMNLLPAVPAEGDAYLYGYNRRFGGIELDMGTAGVGTYTIEWQYWNGTGWAALSNMRATSTAGVDQSSSLDYKIFTNVAKISWDIPADWELTTINSQGPYYYIRSVVDGGTVTTVPLGDQVDFEHTSGSSAPPGIFADLFGDFALKVYKYGFTPFVGAQAVSKVETPTGIASSIPAGADAAILTASQAQAAEDARGTVVKRQLSLPYDGQTSNFTVTATVRGINSGATGVILADVDGGTSGTLFLDEVIGKFEDDEEIRDDNATEGVAVVNSATGGDKRPFNLIHYDGGTGSPAPAIGDTIDGATSSETGVVVAVFGDATSGFLLMEQRSATPFTNNEVLDSDAVGDWAALADISGGGSSADLDFDRLVDADNASSDTFTNVYEYLAAFMAKRLHPIAFQDDGGTFTDFTTEAKEAGGAGDVDLLPATPQTGDAFYFGDQDTLFTSLHIDLNTVMTGSPTIVWEYYNGATWSTLPSINDETSSFTAPGGGMRRVVWSLPTDWATTEINDVTAYWVRARLSVLGTGTADADQIWTDKTFEDVHIWSEDEVSQLLFSGPAGFFSRRNVANSEGVIVANATGTEDFWTADDGTEWSPPQAVTVEITGVTEGTRCIIEADGITGPLAEGDVILSDVANASGVASTTFFGTVPQGVIARARSSGIIAAAVADDGGALTDETEAGRRRSTTNDVTLFPTVPVVNVDQYYFGGLTKFSKLIVRVGTAGVGTYVLTWEYWNGSWVTLTTTQADDFKATGPNEIRFAAPGDWATTSVNGQGPYFYIRARWTSGTMTTSPIGNNASMNVTKYLPFQQANTITASGLSVTAVWIEDTIAT
jgi:hypothetical protein